MLDASVIAAIVTGILALVGALATAWTSKWNEHRKQARVNKRALARSFVPLVNAAWDLNDWLYDILDDTNYSPKHCAEYGAGWNAQFTSYLLGQYFASVHIIRERTHLFAHITGIKAEMLKKLLWKIQDEFVSMNYEGRENLEMRWFEGDVLALQEHMTVPIESDGQGASRELRTIGWVEFQKKYARTSGSGNDGSPELCQLFQWYEEELQRIIYRRFKSLYATKWPTHTSPQAFEVMMCEALDDEQRKKLVKEEEMIGAEQLLYPDIKVVVPDHRVRRIQHLLSDLVEVLDDFTAMNLNRPVRRCSMIAETKISYFGNSRYPVTGNRIPCDCNSLDCNPRQEDFVSRKLPRTSRKTSSIPRNIWRTEKAVIVQSRALLGKSDV